MVCAKCEKKLSKVICPEKKTGKDIKGGGGSGGPAGGRKLNENKLLSSKNKWKPYGVNNKCTVCKSPVHQEGKYCQNCAYKKGVCAMCGKQVMDTAMYKQSCT